MTGRGRVLRAAGRGDRPFLRDLSRRVFSRLGRYDRMVPEWLDGPGACGIIALEDGERVGFAITCLVSLSYGAGPPRGAAAEPARKRMGLDLLAIAVVPARHRTGIGRWLLGEVIADAARRAAPAPVEILLTVAQDNLPARSLFEAHGFRALPEAVDPYPSGVPALRMARAL